MGGTALKKVLDFAAVYGSSRGAHGPTDLSPVGMAAALHPDLAVHNFGIQEYCRTRRRPWKCSGPRTRSRTGCCTRPTRPGWGWSWTWTRPAGSPTVPRTCR
ncbi:enolase C-terminal domain-like protein [Saccharothrix sp. NRRL B-16314]|uniref:enolase C-terminal domain-like protein n=1 Tax=Saccharothrix sp. NRRL B-16314 TaxID=1463825 RepID=UPI0009DDD94C